MSIESPKTGEKEISPFVFPNLESERGEIERVANEFAKEDPTAFTNKFIERSKGVGLVAMREEMWNALENTDSHDIKVGDWSAVENHAVEGNPKSPRDWQKLKSKIEGGESLDAPIVCEKGGKLHLVSGNTRLMVAKALGMVPQVLLVKMD